MHIGLGYDVHQLVPDRPLWLGGIQIPHSKGLLGHSDADVLLHAICDAILGAAALGDIGQHFPDNDPQYKNIDSKILLRNCLQLINQHGFRIGNIDVLVTAEAPKLNPYRDAIQTSIAGLLETKKENVGLQLMTNEGLDALGHGEAIAAKAIVLLEECE